MACDSFQTFPRERQSPATESEQGLTPTYVLVPATIHHTAKEEIKSVIPWHLRKPWSLLRQANSERTAPARRTAVLEELAAMELSDGECRQLAQASNLATAVGLARTASADSRLFLPPPPHPEVVCASSIAALFRRILGLLPTEGIHECITFFTKSALEKYISGTFINSL